MDGTIITANRSFDAMGYRLDEIQGGTITMLRTAGSTRQQHVPRHFGQPDPR